jgi:hypothetical protein
MLKAWATYRMQAWWEELSVGGEGMTGEGPVRSVRFLTLRAFLDEVCTHKVIKRK